jgi:hypothetical protein
MTNGLLHQYEWALARLEREFGAGAVAAEASPDGRRVAVTVAGGEGREPYEVLLRDPVLGNVNGFADPAGFLDAEVRFARGWFEGTSPRRRTYG